MPHEVERSKPKQFTTATFWITATIEPYAGYEHSYIRTDHAQVLLELLWERWKPAQGKSFVVTHASADGDTLKLVCTYSARGANADDARKRLLRAARGIRREVVGRPSIVRK